MTTTRLFISLSSLAFCAAQLTTRCRLGTNGPNVSCIALGTLRLNQDGRTAADSLAIIQNAVANGITTFDLSDVYGGGQALHLFGQALQLSPGLREKVEIIAKMDIMGAPGGFGYDTDNYYDASCDHLTSVLSHYLSELATTYVDVLMLHHQDYLVDGEELAICAKAWTAAGSVRYVGVSNFERWAFTALNNRVPLVANEIELSPINAAPFKDGTVDFHYATGTTVLAWGPLGGDCYGGANRLFGVGSRDDSKSNSRIRSATKAIAAQLGDEEDVTIIAWLMRHPSQIIPIIGTMNLDRLKNQTRGAAVAARMTRAQWYHISDAVGIHIW